MTDLARLDALYLEAVAQGRSLHVNFTSDDKDFAFLIALHNAYPALRDEIASLRDRLAAVTAERDELKEDGKRIEGLLHRWLFMNSIAPRMDTEEMQIIANAAMAVLKQETRIRLDLPVPKEKAARAASEGKP